MLNYFIAIAAGRVCGVLSGFGIGGGTLLMVWMSALMSMEQRMAQGVNLLYFLPVSAGALPGHFRGGASCQAKCNTLLMNSIGDR